MSIRPLLAVAGLAALMAACAPVPGPYGTAGSAPAAFSVADFGWSQQDGRAVIDGRVAFDLRGETYACTGSVVLTPDTPYTRARFNALYGSINRAAIPEPIVRARNVQDPNADYRSFVRQTRCVDNRFRLENLPDGSWFVIAPVSAGAETIVLMRRVQTRGGRTVTLDM